MPLSANLRQRPCSISGQPALKNANVTLPNPGQPQTLIGRKFRKVFREKRLDPLIRPHHRREAAEPAPCDVLEEDALDGLVGAEREHLVERRRDGFGHGRIIPSR